jgi:hypothetical protein
MKLGLTTNYALTQDDASRVRLNNKTAPIDAMEIISYASQDIGQVKNDLNLVYPSPVRGGIQYSVVVQETLSTTDDTDTSFRVDEPIIASLSIRHPKSGNITGAIVGEVVCRLLSSLFKEDGTWRFDDLMRSAERPVVE